MVKKLGQIFVSKGSSQHRHGPPVISTKVLTHIELWFLFANIQYFFSKNDPQLERLDKGLKDSNKNQRDVKNF